MLRTRVTTGRSLVRLDELLRLPLPAAQDAVRTADSEFRRQEIALFATEGQSGGRRWAPLSPRYAAWKAKRFPGRKILVRTGKMRKDFTAETAPGHVAEAVRGPTPERLFIRLGARGPAYYGYHFVGGIRLPRRPQIQTTRTQADALIRAVRRGLMPHILRAIRALSR